ncbi:LOW QUALITY PROTEIN: serine beta-lactamase-like protein LACTB, mitochondrial [Danio aesculapii]|uniref:LOW QUALITY PROTEIN: serine beta-lactamase-like protein LACTB, mitochondrial n=1 Tax=Danio aesculapii TaxID=1142201 RepID=UPI0024C03BA5|nr:LOW QUALITY PROTEIN: serine beta-lactamase-like protein LACTB, mitochondrial [Danio aesculapii]
MSRLLCLSRRLFAPECKSSVNKSQPFVCLLTRRVKLRDQLMKSFTSAPRRASDAPKHSLLWMFGLGTGFVLALGLNYRTFGSEQCECAEQKTDGHQIVCKYTAAIEKSRDLLQRIKDEVGAPGMVVGVSVDGKTVWCEGLGYADLENRVPCGPDTVMRIASISKPLTAAAVARLWQDGKIDLDAPVQKYVPEFPEKEFDGENVTITPRMLLSHLSGIRHYEKDGQKVRDNREKAKRLLKPLEKKEKKENKEKLKADDNNLKSKEAKGGRRKKEFEQEEYYLKDNFESVIQALDLFKDDPLIFKPGSTFLYSTHAFSLLSAVVERAANQSFLDHMMAMFRELGMMNTVPDENDPIIYNRARFYHLNKKGRVVNCPYVDNSYKWAGGGFLSTAGDLLQFGNALLYSYQMTEVNGRLPGFVKPHTARVMWAPVDRTEASWDRDGQYAQGWLVVEKQQKYGECRKRRHYVSHTGGAVGASSVLLVLPKEGERDVLMDRPPRGVVVSIITNMQSVGLNNTALKIAYEFDKTGDEDSTSA